MVYYLRKGMNKHPLESFAGIYFVELTFMYFLRLLNGKLRFLKGNSAYHLAEPLCLVRCRVFISIYIV